MVLVALGGLRVGGGAGKCEVRPLPLLSEKPDDAVGWGVILSLGRKIVGEIVGHLSAASLPALGLPGSWLSPPPAFAM